MAREKPRYCWNCGFLYAFTAYGETAQDCMFDPEAIRDEAEFTTLESLLESGQSNELLTRPVTATIYSKKKENPGKYLWLHCDGFHCLKGMFAPYDLIPLPGRRHVSDTDVIYQRLPGLLTIIKETERENCRGYFPYNPGFSARQHVELQLEDIRMRREEAFQELAIKVQSYLGGQSIEQQRKANLLTLGLLIVAAFSLALSLISILIASGRLS